jgi:large subunit ribosomal protein L5
MTALDLRQKFKEVIAKDLQKKYNYANIMQAPKLVKVVVNRGLGKGLENQKFFDSAVEELAAITGQKPLITKSKKSIAAFKLRKGLSVGAKVTLRGKRMYDFVTKLIHLSLPKIRDFRGVPEKGFDGRGNYTLGLKEQIIFPEISYEKVVLVAGMDITFVTNAKTDAEAKDLLAGMGMPFRQI